MKPLFLFFPALLISCSTSPESTNADRKPNIIFVLADDLGYGDLGCYGQKRIPTPNLDQLASKGLRFTNCYAGSTVCAPSRCTLMTGMHTGHCTVRGNKAVPLLTADVTVAELLKEAGYVTGIIGKWGIGEPGTTGIPNRQGFDYWFGYLNQRRAHNYYPEYLWRNEEKVGLANEEQGGVATKKVEYSHDLFTKEALSFIERHKDEPFFLYLPYTIPHANNEAGRKLGDGMEVPDYGPFASEDWPNPEKGRAAMIWKLDRDFGTIMSTLDRLEIADDTLVIFTSDNGPHSEGGSKSTYFNSSGPLRGMKRSLHDGGIRVPAIARWPGKIAPGTESDLPWTFWDVLPTLAELAGVSPPEKVDGVSILPTLRGEKQALDRFLYWEFHERGFHQAVRWGKWKAVRKNRPDAPLELYDLEKDLGETTNIAGQQPAVLHRITDYLKGARTDSKDFPIRIRPKRKGN